MAYSRAIFPRSNLLWEKKKNCSFDYCKTVDNILVLGHLQNLLLIHCFSGGGQRTSFFSLFLPFIYFIFLACFKASAFSFFQLFLYICCFCIGKFENAYAVIFVLFPFFSFFVSFLEVLFQFLSGVFFGFVEKAFLVCSPPAHQSLPAQFLLFPLLRFCFGFVLVFAVVLLFGCFVFWDYSQNAQLCFCECIQGWEPLYSWASVTKISAWNIGLKFKNQIEPEARVFSGYSGFLPHQNRPLPACVFLIQTARSL